MSSLEKNRAQGAKLCGAFEMNFGKAVAKFPVFFTAETLHGTAQGLSGGKHIAVSVLSGVGGSGAQPLSVRRPRGPACGVWGKRG